jgi:hypothetical protein
VTFQDQAREHPDAMPAEALAAHSSGISRSTQAEPPGKRHDNYEMESLRRIL